MVVYYDVGYSQIYLDDPTVYLWPDNAFVNWSQRNGEWFYQVFLVDSGIPADVQSNWRRWFLGQGWRITGGGVNVLEDIFLPTMPVEWISWKRQLLKENLKSYVDLTFKAETDDWSAVVGTLAETDQVDEFSQTVFTMLIFAHKKKSLTPPDFVNKFVSVPQYPKSKNVTRMIGRFPLGDSSFGSVFACCTSDGVSQVLTWYVEALQADGWLIEPVFSTSLVRRSLEALHEQVVTPREMLNIDLEVLYVARANEEGQLILFYDPENQTTEIVFLSGF